MPASGHPGTCMSSRNWGTTFSSHHLQILGAHHLLHSWASSFGSTCPPETAKGRDWSSSPDPAAAGRLHIAAGRLHTSGVTCSSATVPPARPLHHLFADPLKGGCSSKAAAAGRLNFPAEAGRFYMAGFNWLPAGRFFASASDSD